MPDIADNSIPENSLKKHAEQMSLSERARYPLVSNHFLDSGLLLGFLGGNRCQTCKRAETLCLTIQSAHVLPI